jgi:hypothetical protein
MSAIVPVKNQKAAYYVVHTCISHSVEARHASMVRRLRTKKGLDTVKGWITNGSRGTLPASTQGIYTGEENVSHAGVNVVSLTSIDTGAVSEAWDEPLTDSQVLGIASLFLA